MVSPIRSHGVPHDLTTNSRSRVGEVLQTDNAGPLSDLHWSFALVLLLHLERLTLLGLQQLGLRRRRLILQFLDVHFC